MIIEYWIEFKFKLFFPKWCIFSMIPRIQNTKINEIWFQKFIVFFLKISPYGVIENKEIETGSADTEKYYCFRKIKLKKYKLYFFQSYHLLPQENIQNKWRSLHWLIVSRLRHNYGWIRSRIIFRRVLCFQVCKLYPQVFLSEHLK